MISKIGFALASLGGILLIAGLLMIKFPRLFSMLGRLPGDINIDNRVFIPLGTSLLISIVLSAIAILFGIISRFLK